MAYTLDPAFKPLNCQSNIIKLKSEGQAAVYNVVIGWVKLTVSASTFPMRNSTHSKETTHYIIYHLVP